MGRRGDARARARRPSGWLCTGGGVVVVVQALDADSSADDDARSRGCAGRADARRADRRRTRERDDPAPAGRHADDACTGHRGRQLVDRLLCTAEPARRDLDGPGTDRPPHVGSGPGSEGKADGLQKGEGDGDGETQRADARGDEAGERSARCGPQAA